MEQKLEAVSLATLGRGSAIERFDDELKRVLENIMDPNTADGVREITVKVRIEPNEERNNAAVGIFVTSKVQGPKAVPTIIYMGKDRGAAVAFEYNPEQLQLGLNKNTKVHAVPVGDTGKE